VYIYSLRLGKIDKFQELWQISTSRQREYQNKKPFARAKIAQDKQNGQIMYSSSINIPSPGLGSLEGKLPLHTNTKIWVPVRCFLEKLLGRKTRAK